LTYSGECLEYLLSLGGYELLIHKKGARSNPLNEAAEELNPINIKSAVKACVSTFLGV